MAVTYDFRILNVSDSVEQLKKIAFGCVERQVANVQTRRTDFNPFGFACRSRRLGTVARACFCPRCAISKKCRNPLPECLFWLLRFFSGTTRGAVATASGAAARRMHRPQRANHPESIQTRHSATPLETPPRRAGIEPVLNRQPAQSTNEAARAQKVAPWFRK